MISKILVPVDGSKPAKKSLEYAIGLAKQSGATIILLSVIDKSIFVQAIPLLAKSTKLNEPVDDYLRLAAGSYLEDAASICKKKKVKTSIVMRSGHPVEEIIKEARKVKADLIVMGSLGKSALKAAIIGSVTFGVINRATKIPVLVVKA